jgi:hypothetical protein
LLFGLLFSTAYYIAWLFAFTLLVAGCAATVLLRRDIITVAGSQSKILARLAGTGVLAFAVGLIPFALIYLPALQLFPGWPFRAYLFYAPFPIDIINVTSANALWGWLVERIVALHHGQPTTAVTPGLTVLFLTTLYLSWRSTKPEERKVLPIVLALAGAAVFAASLLTFKIGTVSGFWLVYHLVPGAKAIRVGSRIFLVVNLWLAFGLGVLLERCIATASARTQGRMALLSGAILLFCVIEQITLAKPTLRRGHELQTLANLPSPPTDCRAFLVTGAHVTGQSFGHVDALWISWRFGLPTLNGVSGQSPPGWRLDDPTTDYYEAARQWIARNQLSEERICLYDRVARRWSIFR